jgi:hypothetical protein
MFLFFLYFISIISGFVTEIFSIGKSIRFYNCSLENCDEKLKNYSAFNEFNKKENPSSIVSLFTTLYSLQMIYIIFSDKYVSDFCISLMFNLTFLSFLVAFLKYNRFQFLVWSIFDSVASLIILFFMFYFLMEFVYYNPIKWYESTFLKIRFAG